MQVANKKIEATNPQIVTEQKDLIIDLKTRVNVLEKELTLINNQTSKELDDLRKNNEALTGKVIGATGE